MQLDSTMDKFYRSILKYADLDVDENGGIHRNLSSKEPVRTSDGKQIFLPYHKHLKNPEGKAFFHLLNENYLKPETEVFNLYKNNLILSINMKLGALIPLLIDLATDTSINGMVKDIKLIELFTQMGSLDVSIGEDFSNRVVSKAAKERASVGYFVNFFLKKNGSLDKKDFSAIGKTKFVIYEELMKGTEKTSDGYKIYKDLKVRKKDVFGLLNVVTALFPNPEHELSWSDGTDNMVFRYLNVLLKVTYMVTKRMNDVIDMLGKDLGEAGSFTMLRSDMEWVDELEKLYDMTDVIRLIPSQTDVSSEGKQRLAVNESKVANPSLSVNHTPPPTNAPPSQPTFNPNYGNPVATPPVQETNGGPSALDIIRKRAPRPQHPGMAPPVDIYDNPVYPGVPQQTYPGIPQQSYPGYPYGAPPTQPPQQLRPKWFQEMEQVNYLKDNPQVAQQLAYQREQQIAYQQQQEAARRNYYAQMGYGQSGSSDWTSNPGGMVGGGYTLPW